MSSRHNIFNLNFMAKAYLARVGNPSPSARHLEEMKLLIARTISPIEKVFQCDDQLTPREIACLLLAAQGLNASAIAKFMNVGISTVRTFRKQILSKLECKNMAQAVYEGIRYEYIKKRECV